MSQFEPGDVVVLKSDSPKMTIVGKNPRGDYRCEWVENGSRCEGSFAFSSLEKVTSKKGMPIFTDEEIDELGPARSGLPF